MAGVIGTESLVVGGRDIVFCAEIQGVLGFAEKNDDCADRQLVFFRIAGNPYPADGMNCLLVFPIWSTYPVLMVARFSWPTGKFTFLFCNEPVS